jgi:hypothetical protein
MTGLISEQDHDRFEVIYNNLVSSLPREGVPKV